MQYVIIFKAPTYDELVTKINTYLAENPSSQIVTQNYDKLDEEVISIVTFATVDEQMKTLWADAAKLLRTYAQALEKANAES